MPIYEYACNDCDAHFESLRSFKDADSPLKCKKCFSEKTRRVMSVFYAHSDGRAVMASSGCGGCSGGSCSSCGHSH